jgi:hypothetical protein
MNLKMYICNDQVIPALAVGYLSVLKKAHKEPCMRMFVAALSCNGGQLEIEKMSVIRWMAN